MARGNRREDIVLDDDDRWMFLHSLGEMARRTSILIHAFALMDNHTSKRDLYLEAMTKALLLDHPKLFIGAHKLLDAKLWYRGDCIIVLYHKLTQLQSLKREKLLAKSNAAKSILNTQIKAAIVQLGMFN